MSIVTPPLHDGGMTNTMTCEHTLVVHADGTHECEGQGCGADELAHEWWAACDCSTMALTCR